jgi:hypothetical protein
MVIAEKQRDKLLAAKEEEANLQKDIQTLSDRVADMDKKEKLQSFQIERLRKLVKKNDTEKKDSTKIKEMSEQLQKLKNENDLLQELLKSLKTERSSRLRPAKQQPRQDQQLPPLD